MRKLITVEEHFDTPEADKLFSEHDSMGTSNPPATKEKLMDYDDRLAYMDKHGIAMQLLSNAGNSPQTLPDALAVQASKDVNDALAKVVADHPTRFAGLATLPVNLPEAAADELRRAVTDLGFKGGLISGNIQNQWLDNEKFLPIFAAAEELDVPLYLHPGYPSAEESRLMFESNSYGKMTESLLSGFGFGWHMDQGLQMARLIFSGIFDKYPKLKLVSGHWGEMVPNFIERMDSLSRVLPGLNIKRSFADYYKENVWITPSGMYTKPQFELAVTEMGVDHILYSEDYPYVMLGEQNQSFLESLNISDVDKEKIAHGNTEKLFKLNV